MKNPLRLRIAVATLSLTLLANSFAGETEAGSFDIGRLTPSATGKFVEINLSEGVLKFAAKIASYQEPEAADLIGGLKHIRINVIGMDDTNRSDTTAKIQSVRSALQSQGWTQIVAVRDKNDGNNVDVHVKQRGDDAIAGLVVTILNKDGEAVFVNVVGNITADQLGVIADKFDIDQLKGIHVKSGRKPKIKET